MTNYFDNYFFTSNATGFVCPGFGSFQCKPPNACARDTRTGRRYCCDTTSDNVCWTTTTTCAQDGSTLDCGSGDTVWCCVNQKIGEKCTQTPGQINICWSSAHNTLDNISLPVLQKTYSSLSAANPSSASLTFDPLALIAATQSPSTSSSTSQSTSTSAAASTTSSASTAASNQQPSGTPGSGSSLTGGAIAGIVIGVLAALALFAACIFVTRRYIRRKEATTQGPSPDTPYGVPPMGQPAPYQEAYGKAPEHYPQELPNSASPAELHGNPQYWNAQELPAESSPAR